MVFNHISRPLIIIKFRIMNCVHLIITSYLSVISKWIRDHHRIFRAFQDGLWLLKKNLQISPSTLKHSRKTCNVSLLFILYLERLLLFKSPLNHLNSENFIEKVNQNWTSNIFWVKLHLLRFYLELIYFRCNSNVE